MAIIGYQLIKDGNVVVSWGGPDSEMPPFPDPLRLPNGDVVSGPKLGEDYGGYILSAWNGTAIPPVPRSITRRQCALQLLAEGRISGFDAVAMVQSGTPPGIIGNYFDSLPEPDKFYAMIDFAAVEYYYDNPLLQLLAHATELNMDNFFREAAKK